MNLTVYAALIAFSLAFALLWIAYGRKPQVTPINRLQPRSLSPVEPSRPVRNRPASHREGWYVDQFLATRDSQLPLENRVVSPYRAIL